MASRHFYKVRVLDQTAHIPASNAIVYEAGFVHDGTPDVVRIDHADEIKAALATHNTFRAAQTPPLPALSLHQITIEVVSTGSFETWLPSA